MSFDHQGRVAFITGAGSGIGRATALRLASEGAPIAVADVNDAGAAETVQLVTDAGGQALAVHCDVRDRATIAAARDAAVEHFGGITYLVNNAGLVTMESLDELPEENWDLVLDVNLKGVYLVTQEINPAIAAGGGGAVVNLSTVESEVVVSSQGFCQVHYAASKGGVKTLTKALAVELGRKNIRVNAVAPGPIATDFVSLEGITSDEAMEFMSQRLVVPRVGQPTDIAAAISFLLSDEASWITGVQLPVDGGWLTPMSDPLADLGGDIDTVIVAAPDIQGRLIGRRVPADTLDVVASEGVSVCTCVYGWDIAQSVDLLAGGDLPYTGMHNGMGDFLLMPDLATLRAATWLDRSAIVLADSVELDGTPTAVAPRTILRRQLDRLAERGLTASVGTELEYYLFHGTPRELHDADYRGLRPTTVRPADFSIAEGDSLEGFLADLRRRLAGADVAVEASQVEWGLGQIETTLVHCDPLAMADRHVLYKLAVRNRAAANAMTATFMAKPVDDQPGSSCHVHLSLTAADDTPVFWDVGAPGHRSDVLHHAIGGVLAHAPELMAWYAPTINSYRRTRSKDAAGWGQTWGVDHRFVSVRVVGHAPRSLRLEFRLPGADTNPYLTLAGVLASVIDGIDARTQPGPPVEGNPFDIDPDAMPHHLGTAAELFAGSDWLRSTFGTDVVDHHATLARFEWSQFLDRVTDWERRRYFDGV